MTKIFSGDFSKLESDKRKKMLPPNEILEKLDIKKGDTLIDFGCGIGYFSIPALSFVGRDGSVVAIDLNIEMIEELKRRTKGVSNIEIIQSDSLDDSKGDILLFVNVVHELDDPKKFLENSFKSLKPNGKMVIIDWQKKETGFGPQLSHRISKEEVINMIGRDYVEHSIDDSLYFLVFPVSSM